MKKGISILILLLIICNSFPIFSQSIAINESEMDLLEEPYEYPVLPGDTEWSELDIAEVFTLSNPSREFCQTITTSALLTTVLTCPFTCSIYAFDSIDDGIEICRNAIYSLDELLNRTDALQCINRFIEEKEFEHISNGGTYCSEYYIAFRLSEYLINQNNMNPDVFVDPNTGWTATYIHTPNNSNVFVYIGLTWSDHGVTSAEANSISSSYASTFSATIVNPANSSYNCHSYAWYHASANNYWMEDPSPYMTDGSYTHKNSAAVGRKVTYTSPNNLEHSGIVTSISGSTVYVTSKWGYLAVFRHSLYNNPYYLFINATQIDYWKKAS